MHESVMEFVGEAVRQHSIARASVLEVGSYDVNGSVRSLFRGKFVGVDMRPGPGVDQVANGNQLPFDDRSYDVVVSTETLEHDLRPWQSAGEMCRVARDFVIVTARGYDATGCFPLHDFPGDHWRFSPTGMKAMLERPGWTFDAWYDPEEPGVFALGRAS